MKKWGLILVGVSFFAACSSSHKLTGTDYTDIEQGTAPELPADYPLEVIEDAGWKNMTTDIKSSAKEEEFRFWFNSSVPPSALYKITKGKKNVEGEHILYWERDSSANDTLFIDQQMRRYHEGTCAEFFRTESYGYCFPLYEEEPKWEQAYQRFEVHDIWKVPDITTLSPQSTEENSWKLFTQVKLGNYYRAYEHENPENYEDEETSGKVINIASAIKMVARNFDNPTTTNLINGIINKDTFTLCDNSESWQIKGVQNILNNNGYNIRINDSSNEYYFVTVKGQIVNNWYSERIKEGKNRKLIPHEVYYLQNAGSNKCPENFLSEK